MSNFQEEVKRRGCVYQWSRGLGLEEADQRAQRMYREAESVYDAFRAAGSCHTEAIEEALKASPRHRGGPMVAQDGLTVALDGLGD